MSNLQSTIPKRQKAHSEIRELMNLGQLVKAVSQAEETLQIEGPHVGLLCDKAACEYELGQFQNCEITFFQIEYEIKIAKDLISQNSARKTYVFLAKFAEEFGEYEKALNYLKAATDYSTTFEEKKWALLQELRILSYIGQYEGLSRKYLSLSDRHDSTANLDIETLHALMWIEWRIFGWAHAEARYAQLESLELNLIDQRLMVRDFIEISIISAQMNQAFVQKAVEKLKNLEQLDFDQALLAIVSGQILMSDAKPNSNLSKMMKLRLILISLYLENNDLLKLELKRKFLFVLESVSKKSRELLAKLLNPFSSEEKQNFNLSTDKKMILVGERTIKLTNLQFRLLSLLAEKSELSLDDLSKKIWKVEADQNLYDRIRMLIYRTNDLLEAQVGFKLLEVTKHDVSLSFRAQIRHT